MFSVFFSRGCGDTMCEGRLSYGLLEGKGGMQWQQQSKVQRLFTIICVISVGNLCNFLDCESRTRWHVCLGKDIPELRKKCGVSWEMGRGAGPQQNCDKWVTRQEQEQQEHVRFAATEPSLHKNWYQMTQPYKSDTDHTMGMWLLPPN